MRDISIKICGIAVVCLALTALAPKAIAISDPLSVPNNKLGIHILSPDEILQASNLVNNDNKGQWGYVVVPIQAIDRDRKKWTEFFNQAKNQKVIPIIRIATFASGPDWAEPNNEDLIDFANFLNDLPWPTQNRYVIIFNEVNHSQEWGGIISPERYADILGNAVNVFKKRNSDFFILPSAMDNATLTNANSLNWKEYLTRMFRYKPEVFSQIDGWNSHTYPNPAFRGKPTDKHDHSISSFKADLSFISAFTSKKYPVFITETGWDMENLSQDTVAGYYDYAFKNIWSDSNVVVVAPFLLRASAGPFTMFSLIKDNQPTAVYKALQQFASTGSPLLASNDSQVIKPVSTSDKSPSSVANVSTRTKRSLLDLFHMVMDLLFPSPIETTSLQVGDRLYQVELADSQKERQQGLSNHQPLSADAGMYFVFENGGIYPFWMKDMLFDIDIVWIKDNKVIGVSQGDHKNPEKRIYPPSEVDRVLEVNINSGIKVGDSVNLR